MAVVEMMITNKSVELIIAISRVCMNYSCPREKKPELGGGGEIIN